MDAEAIAMGMSWAQRKVMLTDLRDGHVPAPYGMTEKALRARGLIEQGAITFYRRVTPLGLSVRAILLRDQGDTNA